MDRIIGYGAGSQWEPISTDRVERRDPVDPGSTPGGSAKISQIARSSTIYGT